MADYNPSTDTIDTATAANIANYSLLGIDAAQTGDSQFARWSAASLKSMFGAVAISSVTVTGATYTIPVGSSSDREIINLASSASVTLTSTPNVQKSSVPTGKLVTLINANTSNYHFVLTDLGTAGTDEVIIPKGGTIELFYDGANWIILNRSDSGLVFRGTTQGSVNSFTISSSFSTVTIGSVDVDPYSKFSSNTWVIPATGYYTCISKLRVNDDVTPDVSYGQGVHTSNVDGPWFQWFATTTMRVSFTARNGSFNSRTALFTRGAALRLYAYADSSLLGNTAGAAVELIIIKV